MSELQERLARALGDRYVVEGELGRGAMAVVYLARDRRHDRRVALKVLQPELAESLGAERFLREIEITAQLNHPRIAPLLDSGSADGLLYYVMSYVEGESLKDRLERDRQLPVGDAVEIARQVAAALTFAHEQGVVHRDIKPGNVLLTAGEAVVADFGVARAVTEAGGETLTKSGVAVGTPAYMSPEQASGEHDLDARSDVYSLGCVLYEMLAGEPPFTGPTAWAVTARKLSESAPDVTVVRDTVPQALAQALRTALAPVPADRYASAQEFAQALRRQHPRVPMAAADTPAGPVFSRRSLLLGAAATGLGGFAGGAFAGVRVGTGSPPRYHRLTFQRGMIRTARFEPDFQNILYGALWGGDVCRVYRVRPDSPQSHPVDLPPATPLAVSSRGQVALALGAHFRGVLQTGTLATVPLAGGVPREMLEGVSFADWSPDGSELAIARTVGGQRRLEFPVGNVIAEPPGGISFPRVSPEGDRVAFIELSDTALVGSVATVDRQGRKTVLTPESPNVFGLAWNGDEIWFTVAEERPLFRNAIHAVRPDGSTRVVTRLPSNGSLHDVSPEGRVLIARTEDRGGISLLRPGETRERDLSWLDNSNVADIASDGSTILFWERGVGGGPDHSVYVRDTSGGPAVRLGAGRALALSPDGRWALTAEVSTGVPTESLVLLPVGAGEQRRIERPGFTYLETIGRWLPDGERALVYASERDRGYRFYTQEVDGDGMNPVTPAHIRVQGWELSPDGTVLAVLTDGAVTLYPVDGGDPRKVPGAGVESLVGWIDGGVLVIGASTDPPDPRFPIERLDPVSGRRVPWREIQPRDPVGLMVGLRNFVTTPDGSSYAYSWFRALSDLYEVEGLE